MAEKAAKPGAKGIVLKTFVFSTLLIALVLLLSFMALYFIMPVYYRSWKGMTLQRNTGELVAELRNAGDKEAAAAFIADFASKNNADVISFGAGGQPEPELSSPFVSMKENQTISIFYTMRKDESADEASEPFRRSIIIKGDAEPSGGAPLEGAPQNTVFIQSSMSGIDRLMLTALVGSELIGHISVSGTMQPIDDAKDVILSLLPYVLVIGVALALLFAWLYARQLSKPILSISTAALKMQRLDPHARSGIRTNDELGDLSYNLDTLYEKLRENIESLNREMEKAGRLEQSKTEMMQSASHELKTPIAALGGMIDGMIDNVGAYKNREKYLCECKAQVEKLSVLVCEILSASKADMYERALDLADVRIDALLNQALEEYAYQLGEKELSVSKNLLETSKLTDPALMYRVLTNLISNAARYTPMGGRVSIELTDEALSIENECEKISDEELSKLFEPFYTRSYSRDKAQSGVGLGLYIVKRNLERLGVDYKAQYTGRGLRITLTL